MRFLPIILLNYTTDLLLTNHRDLKQYKSKITDL